MNKIIHLFTLFFAVSLVCYTQTSPSDEAEKITTEEIKINVSATDRAVRLIADVKKEDLVINEDGRLH